MNRDELVKRRANLKAQHEWASRLARIKDLTDFSEQRNIEYRVYDECTTVDRVLGSYPANISGVNWKEIANSKIVYYDDLESRNITMLDAVCEHLDISDKILLTWSNGTTPVVETCMSREAEVYGAIADEDWDVWIINSEKGFCLEHYHEGYVAWTVAS